MAAATQGRRRELDVHATARAQTHAHRPVVIFEERRRFDAFDRAQMLHDLFGVLTVGVARGEHRFVDVRPAIATIVLQRRALERHPQQPRRGKPLVREDLFGDERLVGSGFHEFSRDAQHFARRVGVHERTGIGHDRGQ